MIKNLKKIIAGISAIVLMATATACGADTKWALQYGEYEARAGIFLFYQMSAYSEAIAKLQEDNPDLDTTDTKNLQTLTVEDTPISTWIQDQTTEKVELYLEVLKQFDELGLELEETELASIDATSEAYWQYYANYYTQNGIGEQSFKDINIYSYKIQKVFEYYYGEGGIEEVPEQDLKDYYEEHNARVKYICLNSTDADGNFLSDEMKNMAESFLTRANVGEDFDTLIEEYESYKTKLAEEQEEQSENESTGTLNSTSANSPNEEETMYEDAPSEGTAQTEEPTEHSTLSDEDVSVSSQDIGSDDIDDNLTLGDSVGTDDIAETTEEENPYPNEYIIQKTESNESGSPTVKVNQEIFAQTEFGKAFLVEEDNAYYVVVKYNIWERDDLWTDDTKSSVLSSLKNDDFEKKMLSMVDDTIIVKNNKAYNRYNPFDMKF